MKKRYIDRLHEPNASEAAQEEALKRLVQAHLDDENRLKWAEQLQQQGVVRQQKQPQQVWKYLAAAAIVLLLASVGTWWLLQPATATELATTYIKADEHLKLPAGFRGNTNDDTRRSTALQAFNDGDYAKTLQLMSTVASSDSTLQRDLFLKGMSHFYLHDYPQAITVFEQMDKADNGQVDWFLALSFLKTGNNTAAKPALERLLNDPVYAERVQKLLARLDQK